MNKRAINPSSYLLLATLLAAAALFLTPDSAQAQVDSNWTTASRYIDPSSTSLVAHADWNGQGGVTGQFWTYTLAINPAPAPAGMSYYTRIHCYTNAAHSGAYYMAYGPTRTSGASTAQCPASHPYGHAPSIRVHSNNNVTFAYYNW